MKKIFIFMLLMVGFVAMAQDTTSVTIDYIAGMPILDFLKVNWFAFAAIAYAIGEYWIGKTKAFEENSFPALILGIVGRWLKKKK
jgi:hypothetical protein